ncbi:DNA polymerase III delta prime subunit [Tamilnaduibacter salinus]|uniref:DNA-directed DNA polymerase n=1 Tax=Tamilnaduibacter salinus TaxID=1484056 RepID=A0A2U1CZN0_9GAMM|nr:DNA polymerase III subunit delta' [Tamilnaduibacter salinus]PVY78256.1 DNA polymerase III delta prime subunit [Tamilnaduibacter salinus]
MTDTTPLNLSTAMPWLAPAFQSLVERFESGRLPHALLVEGRSGVGKALFAMALAQRFVCDSPHGPARCGQCRQCQLIDGDSHPDIRRYRPEKSRVIKVDQVRALGEFAVASPQVAARKIIVLETADQLNTSAANALLKTLEEPVEDVTLILLQRAGQTLMPTIRSRCQSLTLPLPETDVARTWLHDALAADSMTVGEEDPERALRMAGGAPLKALSFLREGMLAQRDECLNAFRAFLKSQQPVDEASKPFVSIGIEATLDLMEDWTLDMARFAAGGCGRDADAAPVLRFLAGHNSPGAAHTLRDAITESRRGLSYNLSPALETERLLVHWQSLMPRRQQRA